MQFEEATRSRPSAVLRWLLTGTFLDLGLFLLVVLLHAFFPLDVLWVAAEGLGVGVTILGVFTLLSGVVQAWRSHRGHRRTIIFLVVITLATLAAHLYVIG